MSRHLPTLVIALVTSCAVLAGWTQLQPAAPGGVAVVDLDEIARRLGRAEQMQQSVSSQTEQLNQQLTALQKDAALKLDKLKGEVGPVPSEEKSAALQRVSQSINGQLNNAKQMAELKVNQYRQKLAVDFRIEAKPYAEKVARERGFATVVTKNDTMVYSFSESVDISGDVFKAMQQGGHAAAAPAAHNAADAHGQQAPERQPSPIQQAGFEAPAGR